jgi:hypothetical protein
MGLVSEGLPACLHAALTAAQARYRDVALSVARDGAEYLIMAATGGRVEVERVPECIVNNEDLPAVMEHYFEELTNRLTP